MTTKLRANEKPNKPDGVRREQPDGGSSCPVPNCKIPKGTRGLGFIGHGLRLHLTRMHGVKSDTTKTIEQMVAEATSNETNSGVPGDSKVIGAALPVAGATWSQDVRSVLGETLEGEKSHQKLPEHLKAYEDIKAWRLANPDEADGYYKRYSDEFCCRGVAKGTKHHRVGYDCPGDFVSYDPPSDSARVVVSDDKDALPDIDFPTDGFVLIAARRGQAYVHNGTSWEAWNLQQLMNAINMAVRLSR